MRSHSEFHYVFVPNELVFGTVIWLFHKDRQIIRIGFLRPRYNTRYVSISVYVNDNIICIDVVLTGRTRLFDEPSLSPVIVMWFNLKFFNIRQVTLINIYLY